MIFAMTAILGWDRLLDACHIYRLHHQNLRIKLLADLLDLEENLIINMHLRPIDPKAAIKSLKSTLSNIQKMKIEEQKKAVRSGYDMDIIPTDISTYGEDVEGLLNEIQSRNEKLFELTFLLMNTADNKRKLDNIVYQTAGIAQKYNCNIRRLQYQQEQGLVASLPLGMNQTGIQRIMTTTSTAIICSVYHTGNFSKAVKLFTMA